MTSNLWADVAGYAPDGSLLDVYGQNDLDVMCAVLHLIGTALNQRVYVTPENTPDRALLVYDPSTSRVTAAPSRATHAREDAESA